MAAFELFFRAVARKLDDGAFGECLDLHHDFPFILLLREAARLLSECMAGRKGLDCE